MDERINGSSAHDGNPAYYKTAQEVVFLSRHMACWWQCHNMARKGHVMIQKA